MTRYVLLWLAAVNLLALVLMAVDKTLAKTSAIDDKSLVIL